MCCNKLEHIKQHACWTLICKKLSWLPYIFNECSIYMMKCIHEMLKDIYWTWSLINIKKTLPTKACLMESNEMIGLVVMWRPWFKTLCVCGFPYVLVNIKIILQGKNIINTWQLVSSGRDFQGKTASFVQRAFCRMLIWPQLKEFCIKVENSSFKGLLALKNFSRGCVKLLA